VGIDDDGEVHIWTASPQALAPHQWPRLNAWLDPQERVQCLGFHHEADRHAYALAHALRRLAVARALGVAPALVAFSSTARRKPVLAAPPGSSLHVSLSRSRALVACAVTRIGPVGIDVEPVVPAGADMGLLHGLVALPERPARAQPGTKPFFFYWTLLEAYWKCRGTGLSLDQPALHFMQPAGPWLTLGTAPPGGPQAPGAVLARPLPVPPGCAAALALDAGPSGLAAPGIRLVQHPPTDWARELAAGAGSPPPTALPTATFACA